MLLYWEKLSPFWATPDKLYVVWKFLWFIYLFSNSSSAGISKSVLWFQLTSHICHLLCVWLWDWQEELTFQRAVIEKYPSPHSSLCAVSLTEVYWRKLPKVLQCISWNSKKGAAQDFCKHFYHGKHWPQSVFFLLLLLLKTFMIKKQNKTTTYFSSNIKMCIKV